MEDTDPLSFLHRIMQKSWVSFLVQPVMYACVAVYQHALSHAIFQRQQEALVRRGEKGRLLHVS